MRSAWRSFPFDHFQNGGEVNEKQDRGITRAFNAHITVAIAPIMMMLLFVYVFGGAIETGKDIIGKGRQPS